MDDEQKILKELFNYIPETGEFLSRRTGRCCGWIDKANGGDYLFLDVRGKKIRAHRAAFLYMTGRIPQQVDHIDGNRKNNRWANLRAADSKINARNRAIKSDSVNLIPGVYWDDKRMRWRARIGDGLKMRSLLTTHDFFEACCARKRAELLLGYTERHGSLSIERALT